MFSFSGFSDIMAKPQGPLRSHEQQESSIWIQLYLALSCEFLDQRIFGTVFVLHAGHFVEASGLTVHVDCFVVSQQS